MNTNGKYVVIGTIEALPEHAGAVLQALREHSMRCLRDEPGTLRLDCLVTEADQRRFMSYELYVDEEAFIQHKGGASLKQILGEIRSKVVALSSVRCRVSA
jgi:quinol monooxygenase YgiN